ncbi:SalK OS=Streptomyces rimosus subsp. rimosus (strain ATCC / DSM 40260 / JCM 4667 / NRRL 2234) OX=1265868 GN=SRIM_040120 PE=4 SV=1 [Streptomyces rimosus subsp. rimosus]
MPPTTLPDQSRPLTGRMDMDAVREASRAVNAAHLFIYLVPETAEEAAKLGVTDRGPAYFAFRSAAMGAVPWQVVLAAFYNFSPRAVRAVEGVWETASPSSGRPPASRPPNAPCAASA